MSTIGLCMIVRDEIDVIRRCLESVVPLVDHVVVLDTGSEDNTPSEVLSFLDERGIHGWVYHIPWRDDFAEARNAAFDQMMKESRATDYVLVIDADDVLAFSPGFDIQAFKDGLRADCYELMVHHGPVRHFRPHLTRLGRFRYVGVLHEHLEPVVIPTTTDRAEGLHILIGSGGARSKNPDKFKQDAVTLGYAYEAAFWRSGPDSALTQRYAFYLAQSLRDSGQNGAAQVAYLKRANMGGWRQEVFCSYLNAARLADAAGEELYIVIDHAYRARTAVPEREVEAFHTILRAARGRKEWGIQAAYLDIGIPPPPDGLFVEPWIYERGMLDERSVLRYWRGEFHDAITDCEALLAVPTLPDADRPRVEDNLRLSRARLAEQAGGPAIAPPVARSSLPVVCVYGVSSPVALVSSSDAIEHETRDLTVHCAPTDESLATDLLTFRPHVIVSFGNLQDFRALLAAPMDVRRRWLAYGKEPDLDEVGRSVWACYLNQIAAGPITPWPLVSVFTPLYRTTQAQFERAYRSLQAQAHDNWEWVLWDDTPAPDFIDQHWWARDVMSQDPRVRYHRGTAHSGRVGEVKRNACGLTRGSLLVELDHDDALTPIALWMLREAANEFPDAGFFYTDYAMVNDAGAPLTFGDGWAYGLGRSHTDEKTGLIVCDTPGISSRSIRDLVGAPNHMRAWRRSTYWELGGHNSDLAIADDFDLLIRTFLATRMVHIPVLGYIQHQDGPTTTDVRRGDIRRHVRGLRHMYDRAIHERFLALGVDDYAWNDSAKQADMFWPPNPETVPVASLVANLQFLPDGTRAQSR